LKLSSLFLLAALLTFAACSKQHKTAAVVSSGDFEKGTSFLDSQNDSAYYYFNKVATSSKDSLQIAVAYNYMARIQSDGGDYYGGQETLLESLSYLRENKDSDQYCLSSDFDALGSTSLNLKNYAAAITYYDRAIALMKNEKYRDIELNNKGFAYQKEGQYTQAIAIYESILPSSRWSKTLYPRVITNLAMASWLSDPAYRAAPELLMALQIRKAADDDWGLNSSYAHLSDYYLTSPPDSALLYSRSMYAMASRLQSPDDELEALQKLVVLSPANESKAYFIRFQHLNDSLQAARNAAKNQFALIRYEAEKNKTDILRLQQENDQRKLQILRQRIILYSSIFGLLVVIGVLFWANKTRLRRYQLRTSRKVHDIVANGLYLLITEIEHGDQIEKESLLDQLEHLYERSRDISYDIPETPDLNYSQTISGLLKSYSSQSTMVLIQGNDQDLWDKIAAHPRTELKRVLQELMTNMQKHSDARNVLVQFEQEGDQLKTRYTDDGVGFLSDQQYGNGLINTGNRIKSIGGRIIFDKNTPKGLKIEIYFPIG
jgi:tetratricopeptide (TPR) repeat protein